MSMIWVVNDNKRKNDAIDTIIITVLNSFGYFCLNFERLVVGKYKKSLPEL